MSCETVALNKEHFGKLEFIIDNSVKFQFKILQHHFS